MGALALLQVLGAPMIPCMMMVLGAVLYKGPGTASVAPRLIIGVAFVRLLLIPLLGTAALHDPMHLLQCLLFVPQILRGQQCISCSACLLSLSVQPLMRHSIVFGCFLRVIRWMHLGTIGGPVRSSCHSCMQDGTFDEGQFDQSARADPAALLWNTKKQS